ncbi:adipose-secreted signaling protein [Petromyzon marinus]|uniref:Adipose-secreted signaling protein n=1 Tax=Petromyzon marinus TaxID=7757 RepID=A0AAJ7SX82_PETMA|nr:UPF0687 protein C20orf27 homolog [Petromyzon marinus]XP_032806447.1 UPF0687 protein C20orf27 homolog [Petromyzon marinus]
MAAAKKAPAKHRSGGVHFGEVGAETAGHVHFDDKLHDSIVMVTQETDGSFLTKVGFLKIGHKYEITFEIPSRERLGQDVCVVSKHNLFLQVTGIKATAVGHVIECLYIAHKEGVLREEFTLASETNDRTCARVAVQARVMGRHQGTPMLLEGVKCVGMEAEYDSEQSDWHGFD